MTITFAATAIAAAAAIAIVFGGFRQPPYQAALWVLLVRPSVCLSCAYA